MLATITLNLINGVSQVLRQIGGGLGQLNTQFGSLNQTIELFGKGLALVGSGFGLGPALAEAGRFEDAMAAVRAVTGATGDEFERLKTVAEEAGQTTVFSSVEAANGLAELARAGFSASASISALNPVLQLAQGQQLQVARASEIVTTTLTQFGLAAKEAGRVADVLASGADKSSTSVEQMGNALSYAAPLARQLGLTLEETSAIIGALANEGFRGERAGTALRNVFGQLANPASKFSEALRAAGIESENFGDLIAQLAEKGEVGKRALLALDAESRPAILALVNSGSAGLKQLQTALENSAGAARNTAEILGGTFNATLQKLTNTLGVARDSFLEPLLQPLAAEFTALAEQIAAFTRTARFDELSAQFKEFVLSGVGAFKAFIAEIDFTTLTSDIIEFGKSAVLALDDIAAKAGIVVDGIRAVGDTFGVVKNFFQATGNIIVGDLDAASAATDRLEANFEGLGFSFQQTGEQAKQAAFQTALLSLNFEQAGKIARTSASEFETVGTKAADAAKKAGEEAEKAAPKLKKLGEELKNVPDIAPEFTKLSVSVDSALPGLSALGDSAGGVSLRLAEARLAAQTSLEAFVALARTGVASAEEIGQAFDNLVINAKTKDELYALQIEFNRLVNEGVLTFEKLGQSGEVLADKLTNRLSELTREALPSLEIAFERLGIVSQATLEKQAADARLAFDAITEAARTGTGSLEDIGRAFEAYARKQLAAVAGAEAWKREQVEAALRVEAATLGVTDSLEAVGLAGEQAGAQAAAGIDVAAESLGNLAREAAETSESLDDVGSAASSSASALADVADQAGSAMQANAGLSASLGNVSAAFAEAIRQASGLQGSSGAYREQTRLLTEELERQQEAASRRIQQLDEELARYDPLTKYLEEARREYGYLDDALLRGIAERMQRLDRERERGAEDARREEQAAASSSARREREYSEELARQKELDRLAKEREQSERSRAPTPAPPTPSPSGGVQRIELVVRNEQTAGGASLQLSQSDIRRLVDAVLREIEQARLT